ncbi:hypothetical protein Tco_1480308, partial [Tanacetum coccineum]
PVWGCDIDNFVKSEEAYKNTKLPRGEHLEKGQGIPYKGPRLPRVMQSRGPPKVDGYNTYHQRDHYQPMFPKTTSLELEAALKFGKLNHLIRDRRQRGGDRGKHTGNNSTHGKIINIVYKRGDSQKYEPLIIEAERRVVPKGHDEVHNSTSVIPIQLHLGANRQLEIKQILLEEQPNEEVVESGESSTEEELINLLKDNKDEFALRPANMSEWHKKNVHRFQEPQLSMSKRLPPFARDRPEDRGSDGVPVQVFSGCIQGVPPNPNVIRR